MSEALKRAVQAAMLKLLKPVAKLLLEAGIGVGEFTQLAKIAFVHAAREQGQSAGGEIRRPSATRIAVVTGLTRKDVAAILSSSDEVPSAFEWQRQRTERVLSGWWTDSDFLDEHGQPLVLPEKDARRSFQGLCERYSGDPRFAAILEELIRVGAVRRLADGRVKAESRSYATVRWDPEGVAAVGEELADHCESLLYNLKNPHRPHFVRRVINASLNPLYAPMLRRDLEQSATNMADAMDDALNFDEYSKKGAGGAMRLGIGIYLIESPPEPHGPTRESDTRSHEGTPRGRVRRSGGRLTGARRAR